MARVPKARSITDIAREPTTWAGLFSVVAAIMSGGVTVLTDPVLLAQVGAGLSLIVAREKGV